MGGFGRLDLPLDVQAVLTGPERLVYNGVLMACQDWDRETSARRIAQDINMHPRNAQKALAVLEDVGLIKRDGPSNRPSPFVIVRDYDEVSRRLVAQGLARRDGERLVKLPRRRTPRGAQQLTLPLVYDEPDQAGPSYTFAAALAPDACSPPDLPRPEPSVDRTPCGSLDRTEGGSLDRTEGGSLLMSRSPDLHPLPPSVGAPLAPKESAPPPTPGTGEGGREDFVKNSPELEQAFPEGLPAELSGALRKAFGPKWAMGMMVRHLLTLLGRLPGVSVVELVAYLLQVPYDTSITSAKCPPAVAFLAGHLDPWLERSRNRARTPALTLPPPVTSAEDRQRQARARAAHYIPLTPEEQATRHEDIRKLFSAPTSRPVRRPS